MRPAEDDSQLLSEILRTAFPHEAPPAGSTFLFSPEPFRLGEPLHKELGKLGYRLHLFAKACNTLYHLSAAGKQPSWIAEYIERGQPAEAVELSRRGDLRNRFPSVFVPKVVLTENGYAVAGLDYSPLLVLLAVKLLEVYDRQGRVVLGTALDLASRAIEAPFKPLLKEKMWFALFWLHPLRAYWRQELSERQFLALRKVIPRTWLVDPAPLPRQAVIGGLEVQSWQEVAGWPREQRDYVLEASSPTGPAAVYGAEVSDEEWRRAIDHAVKSFGQHPHILQQVPHGRLHEQPSSDASGNPATMLGAVRLHPIYFLIEEKSELRSALAIIGGEHHSLQGAMIVPAAI